MSISIVIPAYNEAQRLPDTLGKISAFAGTSPEVGIIEIIVVDDGSRDMTGNVARIAESSLPVRVVSYDRNSGKGYAIRRGVMQARGEIVLLCDADLSTPITELPRLVLELDGYDMVIGSRALDQSRVRLRQNRLRQKMGRTFNSLMKAVTGVPFHDTQCGFKLLRSAAAKAIFLEATTDRFAYDVEMILLASRMGYRIKEVPVLWFNSADSRVQIVSDSLRMMKDLVAMRMRLGRYVDRA